MREVLARRQLAGAARRAARSARRRRCAGGSSRGSPGARRRTCRPSRSANVVDDAARSSRARSPRRSAGGGAPSRRRRPRRSASSARRSRSTSSPRRSRAASRASISFSQSSGQPMCSVPRPRWLCVATGTASKMRSISSSEKPSLVRRSRAWPATSCCAHGQAVMPCAATPTSRRVPRLARDRRAVQRVDLLRLDAGHRRGLVLRVARGDRDLGAQRVLALAHAPGDALGELLGLEAGLVEDHLADGVVDDLLEARHVRALLLRTEVDEALEVRGEELRMPSPAAMRMTFSTPVTPTRESETWTVGADAWTSGWAVSVVGCMAVRMQGTCARSRIMPGQRRILVLSLTHSAASHLRRSVRGDHKAQPFAASVATAPLAHENRMTEQGESASGSGRAGAAKRSRGIRGA